MVKFKFPEKKVSEAPKSAPAAGSAMTMNTWAIVSLILGILLVVSFFTGGFGMGSSSGKKISMTDAGEKVIAFAKNQGAEATLVNVTEESGLYKVNIKVQGQDTYVYTSTDGKNLVLPSAVLPLDATATTTPTQQNTPTPTVTQSDKPVVEAFVMSHCPYGTQIEKGLLPVVSLLQDKIDFKIKFVYYAMHGEEEVYEQLNQYCIQEEQTDKYLSYLTCFLEDGDGERCLAATDIDTTKLSACTAAADAQFDITKNFKDQSSWLSGRFPLFNTDKADNDKYQVGGSPTLIINGQEVQVARDSSTLLKTICAAFNEAPSECDTVFDSAAPSPGFGFGTAQAGNNAIAGCGY